MNKTAPTSQQRIAQLATKYRGKGLTEQDTKNALIEPILGEYGWPKEDLERVRAEFRPTSKYNPVDYALLSRGRPVLFVETKALDVSIDDHKAISQVLSYATVAGVDWALITNGHQWDMYAVFARVAAPEKRFFSVTIDADDFDEWMAWIRPERLEGNDLERLWRLLVAERQVKDALTRLLNERNDALVSLLAQETSLDISDVAMALQALQPSFSSANMKDWDKIVSQRTPLKPRPKARKRPTLTTPGPTKPQSLPTPPPGSKPCSLTIEGHRWEVSSWRQMIDPTMEYLANTYSDSYEALFTHHDLQGRKRRYVDRTPENMHSPAQVPGGFIETNLSARKIVAVLSHAVQICGVAIESVTYELENT